MSTVRIAAAQTPEIVGDLEAAVSLLNDLAQAADAKRAGLLCLPEAFLQGYLTEAPAARAHALDTGSPAFERLLARFPQTGPIIVVGFIEVADGRLYNTAIVVDRGVLIGRYRKTHLLAREQAFTAGEDTPLFEVEGLRFGINICNDTNFPQAAQRLADAGAALILCPANNMLPRKSAEAWKDAHNAVRGERCRQTGLWLVSADVTGERDGWVGWGPTAVLDPAGNVAAQLPLGTPGLLVFDMPRPQA